MPSFLLSRFFRELLDFVEAAPEGRSVLLPCGVLRRKHTTHFRFLGDNNRKGIRHLTDADTCTVACSKILVQIHVVGQRQVTCCCRDTVVPYNHGSVVQRRIVFENIDQQLAGQNAVNRDSGLFIFLQGDGFSMTISAPVFTSPTFKTWPLPVH